MAVKTLLPKPKFHHGFLCFSRLFSSDQDLTNTICRILSDNRAPHHDLSSHLRPFSSSLSSTPSLISSVLLRSRRLPHASLSFFLFLSSLPPPSPLSPDHFCMLFSSLSTAPSLLPHFHSLLFSYPYLVSPSLFHRMFSSYSRHKLPSEAVRIFNLISDLGFTPSIVDLHSLLFSLCKYGFVLESEQFFLEIKSQFSITNQTYTILISGWARARDSKRALKLFDEMLQQGLVPDLPCYNAIISALCRDGELGPAHERLKEMRQVHELEPNAATYSFFLRAATEMKDLNSSIKVLDRMKRNGLTPNVFTYNTVIKLLCQLEKIDEAYELLDEMLLSGVKPDVWSYNTILTVHCRLKECNKALRLIRRMDNESCLPDNHTYNMLLKMLLDVGRIDRAHEIWEGMEKRQFYPPAACYAVMVHGLCRKKGRVEEACRYFERMVEEGIPPYEDTCELLRKRLIRVGLRERLVLVVDRMRRSSSCKILELSSIMDGSKRAVDEGSMGEGRERVEGEEGETECELV
ncbi:pentatricopeptide repeat-containing protein [Carex littledalei]|uniref:Pentatricopeptide repeat-containing protein n=1 Tax=Carex littledalei TaxID=544730 RepID=A0A833VNI2_9POAL|nr:pentatricopeptide repeat-containing protein [Carex littledalei]